MMVPVQADKKVDGMIFLNLNYCRKQRAASKRRFDDSRLNSYQKAKQCNECERN